MKLNIGQNYHPYLQKHWQNGNIITIMVALFTLLLFAGSDMLRYLAYHSLQRIYKPIFDYIALNYTSNPHLIFRVVAVLTLLPVLLFGLFVAYRLFRVLQRGTIQQKVANFLGLNTEERYEKALLRQFIIALGVFTFYIAAYYLLKYAIPDNDTFTILQLLLSWFLIITLIFQFYISVYVARAQIIPFIGHYFLTPTSAYNLAIFRIILCLGLLDAYKYRTYATAYWAAMPHDARVSLPLMGWFIQSVPINPTLYFVLGNMGIIVSVLGILGLFTRPALIINIPLSVYVLGVPMFFGKLAHQQIWVWFPAILAFSRCADVLSVDGLIRKYTGKKNLPYTDINSPHYSLPFKFIWLHLGIIYFFAGIMKLRQCGLEWALGKSMINQIQIEWLQNYDMMPAFRIDHYPALAHIGGVGVILMELFYPFLVLTLLTRLISFTAGLGLHLSAGYFMNIGFEDLQKTYASYINFAGIGRWLKTRIFGLKIIAAVSEKLPFPFTSLWKLPDYKAVFMVGTVLYSLNFTCGLLGIHSWPFSSYPTYSALVPDYHWYVYYDVFDTNKNRLDLYALGKAAHHRMESYTPIEDQIYENYTAKDTLTLRKNIDKLWEIWIDNVPALKQADSVVVYLQKSPIAPEIKDSILVQYPLATMLHNHTTLIPR